VAALKPLQLVRPLPLGAAGGRELRTVDEELHRLHAGARWRAVLLVVAALTLGFAWGATVEHARHVRQDHPEGGHRGNHRPHRSGAAPS
jgi:hypothetical protein